MCTVLLPPGDNPIAVNKYIISTLQVLGFLQKETFTKLQDITWPKTLNLGMIELVRTSLWMVLRDVSLRFVPVFTLYKTFQIGYYSMSHNSLIHSVFCLTTGPKPPPKRFLHIVQWRGSSLKWEYPLLSLRSSSSFLRLLPPLLVTSISPFIFPSITCFRRQFLRKIWPIQLAFHFLISCRIFLCSLTLSNTSSFLTRLVQLIFIYLFIFYYIYIIFLSLPSLPLSLLR